MGTDAQSRLPDPPREDLWYLPEVREVHIVLVRHAAPVVRVAGPREIEVTEEIEIRVVADGDVPARALGPTLVVGDVELTEGERLEKGRYVFRTPATTPLPEGAPLAFGWAGHPETWRRLEQRFAVQETEER
jgi:hypothetical protein